MVKSRPILFSGRMVRAILSGKKTQTRRIINKESCPYGKDGDILWVRESWSHANPEWGLEVPYVYQADHLDPEGDAGKIKWKSGVLMPKEASRISLEIVGIGIETLASISKQDAIAEGFGDTEYPVKSFMEYWNLLHSKVISWHDNPHVWVVRFEKR